MSKQNHSGRKAFPILAGGIFLLLVFLLSACSSGPVQPVSETEFVLGTTSTVTLYDRAPGDTFDAVFSRMHEIHDRMTLNAESSEIISVNAGAGEAPVSVSPDTFEVISSALEFSRLSEGAFDLTVGPLVKLWGIGTEDARVPEEQEILEKLKLVDFRNVSLSPDAREIFLEQKDMMIDLGAIAKGYAADEAVRILKDKGVRHAIIDFGGNILVMGGKPDGSPWRIGIQNPDGQRGSYLGIIQVKSKSIVTSGVYERFFFQDDIRYHHILDTATGYPVRNRLKSVTIITGQSMTADALSTSTFSLGLEKGRVLIESLPETEAIFVTEEGMVHLTSGLKGSFKLTDDNYTLAEE